MPRVIAGNLLVHREDLVIRISNLAAGDGIPELVLMVGARDHAITELIVEVHSPTFGGHCHLVPKILWDFGEDVGDVGKVAEPQPFGDLRFRRRAPAKSAFDEVL